LAPVVADLAAQTDGRQKRRSPNFSGDSTHALGALTHVTNRYKLCQLASKATRKLHKPNTRLQDTTNEVLERFKDTVPMDVNSEATEIFPLAGSRAA
jgi:hypothetical protein